MDSSFWFLLLMHLCMCAVIFCQGVLLGLSLADDSARKAKTKPKDTTETPKEDAK